MSTKSTKLEDLIGKTVKISCAGYYRWVKVEDVEEDGKNGRATIDGKLIKTTDPTESIEDYNKNGGGVWAYTEQIVDVDNII